MAIKLYSWVQSPAATPLIWIDPFKGWGQYDPDPIAAAERVAPILMARQDKDRVLFSFHSFRSLDTDNLARIVAVDIGHAEDALWYHRFFWRLHQLKATVHTMVLANEDGFTRWHCSDQAFVDLYADKAAVACLPWNLRDLTAMSFIWADEPWDREAISAWNKWSDNEYQKSLHAHTSVVAGRALGRTVRFVNYGTFRLNQHNPAMHVYRNTWHIHNNAPTTISSPSLYPTNDEEVEWCRSITLSTRSYGGTMIPWICFPSFCGRDRLFELIQYLKVQGVKEAMYWNHVIVEEDEKWLAEVIK